MGHAANGVRRWYNETAAQFEQRYCGFGGWYYKEFEENLVHELVDVCGKDILDLGTGGGRFALAVAERAKTVIGIDISAEMIRIANSKVRGEQNVQFYVMDASQTTFNNDAFDLVLSLGMFEYIDDPLPFLREVFRLLRPGGEFVFTCHQRTREILPQAIRGIIKTLIRRKPSPQVRDQYYRTTSYRIRDLSEKLSITGLDLLFYSSTFFGLPTRLVNVAAKIKIKGLAPLILRLAVWLNRFLGTWNPTREYGPVLIVAARKR
ncbi:MAG: class I SAM-dependent methyltransferase [Chloroflexi bacterium]|nr:class I SAM-dependent methyltransferase [Chloroflexota bacterium]MCL5076410.1 class I SAM-dependent methyltransferase [Chloroflexota bacterium]